MTSFRVEVSGRWQDQRLRTESEETHVFIVDAPGPLAAQVAATQIYGGEAARRRFFALPDRNARVIIEAEAEPV
jgi:hypothetical protein